MHFFSTMSLGCKVNQYEQQQIRNFLLNHDMSEVKFGEKADLIVVHTCCVTHVASSKSRQGIKKAIKANKNARIVVSGCLPSAPEKEISNILGISPNISIVSKEQNLKQQLEIIISSQTNNKTANTSKIKDNMADNGDFEPISDFASQSRAFLKVQDGCDGYCTYCIIPKIRKNVCSRDKKIILAEAQNLVNAGHTEIVLTGIFLGAYGMDTVRRKKWHDQQNPHLAELIDQISQINGLKRLRLSSLEPKDVTDQLLSTLAKHDNIAPHFHLPLQNGSADILRKMGRQYNLNDYRTVIYKLNQAFDRPALTTDIIVGFPGETEDDFSQTLDFARDMNFSKIHVFSFSPRKGTPAADFEPKIAPDIIKNRSTRLQRLSDELGLEFRKQFIGEKIDVIIENPAKPSGRCGRYFEVTVNGLPENIKKGDMVSAILNKDTTSAQYNSRK